MTRWINPLLLIGFLLLAHNSHAQTDSLVKRPSRKAYSHEVFMSGGYNYCNHHFFDAGLRYYHWRNDGQTAMAFAGTAIGVEFSMGQANQVYIPYIGWQGQFLMLGYGIRAEYAISKKQQAIGFTPEVGLSVIEFLRVTGGYRFSFNRGESMGLSGFRFSAILAFPLTW